MIQVAEKVWNGLTQALNEGKSIISLQGSSRSAKTMTILIFLIVYILQHNNTRLSIVRKTLPALKGSVLIDFKDILLRMSIWNSNQFNKTELIYKFDNGSWVEFFSTDDEQKIRGRKRGILFANEANEISYLEWQQLLMRTTLFTVLDYNPSFSEDHWIEAVNKDPDCYHFISTYKDNPFLEQKIIDDIEKLQGKNTSLWTVYGLGLRAVIEGRIFDSYEIIDEIPEWIHKRWVGMDFGYCVDTQTEILTKQGWKQFDTVTTEDETLTINKLTGFSEWQKIDEINIFLGQWEMWSIEKLGHSSLTTHNHNWLIENHSKYKFKATQALCGADNIPAARKCLSLPEIKTYSDHFVELLAWFWTEGQIDAGGISFWQNEGNNAERIRQCLKLEFGEQLVKTRNGRNRSISGWVERPKRNNLCHFAVNLNGAERFLNNASNKIVNPEFITKLTIDQLNLFIDISIRADGSTTKNGTRILTQSLVERLYPIQMACALVGIRTTLYERKSRSKFSLGNKVFQLTLFKARGNIFINESIKKRFVYKGFIWCPTVKNGNWFAKRHGTTYFTGNTNDPTAIVNVAINKDDLYIDEICYRTWMLTNDIIKILKKKCQNKKVISESADPRLVDEIYNAGINIHAVEKFAGSINAGLIKMQEYNIKITKRSSHVKKEIDNYVYDQDKDGKYINEPVDEFNHAIDAARYVILEEVIGKNRRKMNINQLAGILP